MQCRVTFFKSFCTALGQSIFKLEFVSFTCARKVLGVLDQT